MENLVTQTHIDKYMAGDYANRQSQIPNEHKKDWVFEQLDADMKLCWYADEMEEIAKG